MKRLLPLLILMMIFSGCSLQKQENTATFYYPRVKYEYNTADGVIGHELRNTGDIYAAQELLDLYLQGPLSEELAMPFPGDMSVIHVSNDGHTIFITVSDNLATLSGAPLILACSCLGRTAIALCNVESAEIRCENLLLDGKRTITVNADTIIYTDSITQIKIVE